MKMIQILTLISTLMLLSASLLAKDAPNTNISGAKVINDNCSRCHNSRPIDEFSLQEWQVIMPHMRDRSHLTETETQAILEFIKTVSTPTPTAASPIVVIQAGSYLSGEKLVAKYGCLGCHQMNGIGGALGPALDNVVEDKGAAYFLKKVTNPQFNNPASAMPKMPITESELEAIANYLLQGK